LITEEKLTRNALTKDNFFGMNGDYLQGFLGSYVCSYRRKESPPKMNTDFQGRKLKPFLVSISEAARLLGISRSAFYQYISSGQLGITPKATIGNKKLYAVSDIELFVNSGCPNRDNWLKIISEKKA